LGSKASADEHEYAAEARPKTVNRLQQLITEWERESGQPVRRLNLRVASMMLAGALRRAIDDDGAVVFVTRGGVAMELRAGEKARVTGDVDLVVRGDPESLLAHLDASLAEDYEEFSFERNEPQPLELRPHVRRIRVKVAFRTKPFMTLIVEVAPMEAGGDEIEEIAAHDLSTIGLDGPDIIPVLAVRWQIAQKLHAVTEPPLRPGGENPRYWDLIDLQLLQALTGENLAGQGRLPAHIHRTWPAILATTNHDLPRLERPLHHHGQQPRHADHRPRRSGRSRPRAHPRHRHKLKTPIFSRSCRPTSSKPRTGHQRRGTGSDHPHPQDQRTMSRTLRHLPGQAVASDQARSAHSTARKR
jgi:Nucleotidyl transferase AbiEii toxin, Type IV TA system